MEMAALGVERANVVAALQNAAAATGSDFHYLLGTAMRESSLKANARSANSSATGLFQFVDQTWLGLVKSHGAQHGLGPQAAQISKGEDGRYHAAAEDKQAILDLRKNPQVSALMAGEYAKDTSTSMSASLGRPVCGGELYAAHFLGADAACKLIRLKDSAPATSAAREFPQAASANKHVFFNADGSARSVRDVYDWAMKQPGGDDTIRLAPPQGTSRAFLLAATAQDSNIQMLLQGVMNWQPGGGFFGSGGDDSGGLNFASLLGGNAGVSGGGDLTGSGSALSFSPGLLNILAGSNES